ncbi:MAG: DUF1365 domain-containing protein [Proteobacteria bacterium]|nr:DUF1365 domain-containing protein [Pseudomonadota bacterium]
MALKNALLVADVMHKRLIPRVNQFTYKVYYLAFPISRLSELASNILSVNRFNLLSFYEKDHKAEEGKSEAWIRGVLKEHGITAADGDIVLACLPRVLGYVFNPVSFWFCLDKQGGLRAVLAEVNNTFKENHNYLLSHADQRVITSDDWLTASKVFYVSPFLEVKGNYRFRFYYSEDKIGVWINYATEEGDTLYTSIVGKRKDISRQTLVSAFLSFPFVTLKVITLIHYQAVKLWLKKVKYVTRPKPPEEKISKWP